MGKNDKKARARKQINKLCGDIFNLSTTIQRTYYSLADKGNDILTAKDEDAFYLHTEYVKKIKKIDEAIEEFKKFNNSIHQNEPSKSLCKPF